MPTTWLIQKMAYLPKLYTLRMALVLCDVWQMESHTGNMADGKAMLRKCCIEPVVSSRGAVTYGMAKELANILRLLVGQSPSSHQKT